MATVINNEQRNGDLVLTLYHVQMSSGKNVAMIPAGINIAKSGANGNGVHTGLEHTGEATLLDGAGFPTNGQTLSVASLGQSIMTGYGEPLKAGGNTHTIARDTLKATFGELIIGADGQIAHDEAQRAKIAQVFAAPVVAQAAPPQAAPPQAAPPVAAAPVAAAPVAAAPVAAAPVAAVEEAPVASATTLQVATHLMTSENISDQVSFRYWRAYQTTPEVSDTANMTNKTGASALATAAQNIVAVVRTYWSAPQGSKGIQDALAKSVKETGGVLVKMLWNEGAITADGSDPKVFASAATIARMAPFFEAAGYVPATPKTTKAQKVAVQPLADADFDALV